MKLKSIGSTHLDLRKTAYCDFNRFEEFIGAEFVSLKINSVPPPEDGNYPYDPKAV